MVSLPFFALLLFLVEIGYDFFAQVSLDYGVQTAARQVQVGAAQDAATVADFKAKYLCPSLSGLLPCSSVVVDIQPVATDFQQAVTMALQANGSGQLGAPSYTYCPGKPRQLMLLQAIYTSPSLVAAFVPAMATTTADGFVHVTLSSAAFTNENFPVTSAPPVGC